MSAEQDESAKLWKVNRTIHELVKDRGFQVSDDEINMDLATFRAHYANQAGSVDRSQLNFFTNHRDNPQLQIFIFFTDEKSVGVKTMRKLLGILEEKHIQQGIIIFPGNMTPSARKVIVAMASQYKLEEFSESDLLVNITHHTLVPRHELLTPEQKKELLETYRLKETQLPRIQLADPVARYYGLKRGNVLLRIVIPGLHPLLGLQYLSIAYTFSSLFVYTVSSILVSSSLLRIVYFPQSPHCRSKRSLRIKLWQLHSHLPVPLITVMSATECYHITVNVDLPSKMKYRFASANLAVFGSGAHRSGIPIYIDLIIRNAYRKVFHRLLVVSMVQDNLPRGIFVMDPPGDREDASIVYPADWAQTSAMSTINDNLGLDLADVT
ncbi:hypothetical protein ONZ51_g9656 [Trametes cubensis]|uniref:DNA-directed RNA polymerases I, II, and III subunit RPABC1 n=1 Tax=Trametes cubensis TaxID=1111947 RepID=A0AAD7TLE2_9APHY|nr:hypothetical protein ONZ51_g9656 [Trametes cubensis]